MEPSRNAAPPERVVLHVVTRNQRRGAECAALELCTLLAGRGHVTGIVALAPAATEAVLEIPTLGGSTLGWRTLVRLRKRIRSADVVVAHGSRTLPAVSMASLGLSQRLIYQNIGDPLYWAAKGRRRLRVQLMLRRMSAVAALTDQAAVVLQQEFGVAPTRLAVLRNMRDSARFCPPSPQERASARVTMGVPKEGHVVALSGALSPEKRVELAISTIAATEDSQLFIAGDGPERDKLVKLANRVAPNRVRFVGNLHDVRPLLHASDALLLTSESEGVPGVLLEAGLCGLPSVTRAVGYVSDVVSCGETGLIIDSADPAAFAAALEHVLADRRRMGAAARARCLSRFDADVVAGEWSALIGRVTA